MFRIESRAALASYSPSSARVPGLVLAVALLIAAAAGASPLAYVTNPRSLSVSVIDLATDQIVETITRSSSNGWAPRSVAVHPDGHEIYITAKSSVYIYAVTPNGHVRSDKIQLGLKPTDVAVDPDGDFFYISHELDGFVSRVDTNTLDVLNIPIFDANGRPLLGGQHIAVDPYNERVAVAHSGGELTVIDLLVSDAALMAGASTTLRTNFVPAPGGLTISRLANAVIVTEPGAGKVKMLFPSGGIQTTTIGGAPAGVVTRIENNLFRIHVTQTDRDNVFTIGGSQTLPTEGDPLGIAYSEDEDVLVVANYGSDSVTIYRGTPVTLTDSGMDGPTAVAIGPELPPMQTAYHRVEIPYGDTKEPVAEYVTVNNDWKRVLALLKAGLEPDDDSKAFSVFWDGCAGKELEPGEACKVGVLFEPATAESEYVGATLVVPTKSPEEPAPTTYLLAVPKSEKEYSVVEKSEPVFQLGTTGPSPTLKQ